MRKNVASQVVGAQMVSASDGSAFTGAVTVAVTVDAGTQATGSVGSGACTHEGGGFHTYAPAQAETNGNHIAFTFSGTGAVPVSVQVYTVSFNPHDAVRLGLTALPNAAAEAAGGLFTRGTGAGQINQDGNGRIDANVAAISTDTGAADSLEAEFDGNGYVIYLRRGTAQAGAAGTITLDAGANANDDYYNNAIIAIHSGTGAGQSRIISDYTGSTKVVDVNGNWVTNPDNTSVFSIRPFGAVPGATAPTAGEVADAVWDEARVDHVTAGSFGENVNADIVAISGDSTSANNLEAYTDGTTPIPANMTQVSGDATAADNVEAEFDGTGYKSYLRRATAQAGASTTITLDASASSTDDIYNNNIIAIVSGTGIGQARRITDYVGSTKAATVSPAWATNPASGSIFVIMPFGLDVSSEAQLAGAVWDVDLTEHTTADTSGFALGNVAAPPTVAEIADGVWDEATTGHTTSGTFGEQVKTDVDAILVDTAEIGAAGAGLTNINLPNQTMDIVGNITGNLSGSVGSVTGAVGSVTGAVGSVTGNVGGNVTGSVGSVAAGGITATSIANGAFDEATYAADTNKYQAVVKLTVDGLNGEDRWTVIFFENSQPLTSGVTSPTLWVYDNAGTDLIGTTGSPQALSEIGTTETFTHDEATDVTVPGQAYVARVQATIGGSTRTWEFPISRDSASA